MSRPADEVRQFTVGEDDDGVRLDRWFRVFENHKYPHIDPSVEHLGKFLDGLEGYSDEVDRDARKR